MNRLPGEQDGRQAYGLGHSVSKTQFLVYAFLTSADFIQT